MEIKKIKNKTVKTVKKYSFFRNVIHYRHFIILGAKAQIKKKIVGKHLSWLWLIIDPLAQSLIYGLFIAMLLRHRGISWGPFVLTGILTFNFVKSTLKSSVQLIHKKESLIRLNKVPKYIFVLELMLSNLLEYFVAIGILAIFITFTPVRFTINILFFPLALFMLLLLTFTFSCLFMHIGFYLKDFTNIVQVAFRFLFYGSGVIWPVDHFFGNVLGSILKFGNPMSFVIVECRNVLYYGKGLDLVPCLCWFILAVVLSGLSIYLLEKYDGKYMKNV